VLKPAVGWFRANGGGTKTYYAGHKRLLRLPQIPLTA